VRSLGGSSRPCADSSRDLLRPLQHSIHLGEVEIAEQRGDHTASRNAASTVFHYWTRTGSRPSSLKDASWSGVGLEWIVKRCRAQRREAVLKALGTNLENGPLGLACARDSGGGVRLLSWRGDAEIVRRWKVARLDVGAGYAGALASLTRFTSMRYFSFSPSARGQAAFVLERICLSRQIISVETP
jgi:hypothetical protein